MPITLKLYLRALSILLLGYMFLGKGFAYLGIGPLFAGEIVLLSGLLVLFFWKLWPSLLASSITQVLLLFMLWGGLRTVPYLSDYGMDALRDAVIWGYGLFGIIAAALVYRLNLVKKVLSNYARLVPILICALPVLLITHWWIGPSLPHLPGSNMPVLFLKPGDTAIHLGIAMAFLLLGLHQWNRPPASVQFAPLLYLLLPVWLAGFAVAGTINRGGFLAVTAAMAVTAALTQFTIPWKRLLLFAATAFAAALVLDLGIETARREISARQIVINFKSVIAPGPEEDTQSNFGTASWRLQWWQDIIDDTLRGPNFWTGRGFGENLNDGAYGPADIRSPHNSHLTILARAGVPGLALWVLLQGLISWKLIASYIIARRLKQDLWMRVNAWILASLCAFNVNTFFDVYLEGPQGGIWFWCFVGLGIGALQRQQEEFRALLEADDSAKPGRPALPGRAQLPTL